MISVKNNRTALSNLAKTFTAIETLDECIEFYSDSKPAPAYIAIRYSSKEELQIDREIFKVALKAQRNLLVNQLKELGIEYDINTGEV